MLVLITLFTVASGLVIAWFYLHQGFTKKKHEPGQRKTIPGLQPSHPTEGNLPDVKKAGSLHQFLMFLHKKHGPIASFWFGKQHVVSIASPELFREHAHLFNRPPLLFKLYEPLLLNSLQYANDSEGRRRRNLYDRCFSHQAVTQQFEIILEAAQQMKDKLSEAAPGEPIQMRATMFDFAIRVILLVSCGHFFRCPEEIDTFRKNYDYCWHEMENRLRGEEAPTESEKGKQFEKHRKDMYDMLQRVLEQRGKVKTDDEDDLIIDVIMKSNKSLATITADALLYIVAGFHTTGTFLTWCFYYLIQHPDVQKKVYEEIMTVLGDGNVEARALADLIYTRQVLDETLRCSVLPPFAARFDDEDMKLGGYIIPGRTPVIHALGVVMQNEDMWPNPTVFDPDRFSPENRAKLHRHAFEPFGFSGKRKCPGYRLTYVEATVALVVLLRKFKFRRADEQRATPVYGLVTKPAEDIRMSIEAR